MGFCSIVSSLSNVGEFSTFPASTHVLTNQAGATQPELENEKSYAGRDQLKKPVDFGVKKERQK